MMVKVGDVLKTIASGTKYIVERIDDDEITLCHAEKKIWIHVPPEDLPEIFEGEFPK